MNLCSCIAYKAPLLREGGKVLGTHMYRGTPGYLCITQCIKCTYNVHNGHFPKLVAMDKPAHARIERIFIIVLRNPVLCVPRKKILWNYYRPMDSACTSRSERA